MEVSFRILNGLQEIQPQNYSANARITITEIKTHLLASLNKHINMFDRLKLCYMGKFFKNDYDTISIENYKPGHPIIVSFTPGTQSAESQMNLEATEAQPLVSYNLKSELTNYNVSNLEIA